MGKKQRIKDISLGVLIGCMFAGSMPMAMAAVAQINLPVSYNDIKIVIDGKRLNTDNEPFISEGVTYLPVRAIAEAVGKDVSWDGETNTVYIDEKKPETETTYSRTNPAPLGEKQTITIDNGTTTYTATVEITDAERGYAAWKKIKAANVYNPEPEDGMEYILVKAKITIDKVDGDKAISINKYMFDAFSSNGEQYDFYDVTVVPAPEFKGDLYEGGSKEGYFTFLVDKKDDAPKLVFERNSDGSGGLWFAIE